MPMVRRRRPVLRAAGAAALGGAAYRAGKRSARAPEGPAESEPSHSQAERPSGGLSWEMIDQLSELGRLHDQGVLTDEEFEEQKRRYLEGG